MSADTRGRHRRPTAPILPRAWWLVVLCALMLGFVPWALVVGT